MVCFAVCEAESSLSPPLARSLSPSSLLDWQTIIGEGERAAPAGKRCRLLDAVSWRQCILVKKKQIQQDMNFFQDWGTSRERDLSDCTVVPADELEEGHCNWYLHFGSINNTSSTSSWPCCDFEEQANNRQSNSKDWEEGRLKIRFD